MSGSYDSNRGDGSTHSDAKPERVSLYDKATTNSYLDMYTHVYVYMYTICMLYVYMYTMCILYSICILYADSSPIIFNDGNY